MRKNVNEMNRENLIENNVVTNNTFISINLKHHVDIVRCSIDYGEDLEINHLFWTEWFLLLEFCFFWEWGLFMMMLVLQRMIGLWLLWRLEHSWEWEEVRCLWLCESCCLCGALHSLLFVVIFSDWIELKRKRKSMEFK